VHRSDSRNLQPTLTPTERVQKCVSLTNFTVHTRNEYPDLWLVVHSLFVCLFVAGYFTYCQQPDHAVNNGTTTDEPEEDEEDVLVGCNNRRLGEI
jgi:hypothetical protein